MKKYVCMSELIKRKEGVKSRAIYIGIRVGVGGRKVPIADRCRGERGEERRAESGDDTHQV